VINLDFLYFLLSRPSVYFVDCIQPTDWCWFLWLLLLRRTACGKEKAVRMSVDVKSLMMVGRFSSLARETKGDNIEDRIESVGEMQEMTAIKLSASLPSHGLIVKAVLDSGPLDPGLALLRPNPSNV
jgi:hypothetical protein